MKTFHISLVSMFGLLPGLAWGQGQVPAIQNNNGGASATASASAQTGNVPTLVNAPATPGAATVPPGWPPSTSNLAPPPIKLDRKETAAVKASTTWRNKTERPIADADGVVRWVYGNSQTRVVCAPLNICDIELKPGETVNNIRLGDTGFWSVTLALSGGSDGRVTHVAITPRESGREASMLIYTDQRTYSIKLVSTAGNYTARTGFSYSDTEGGAEINFAAYRAAVGSGHQSGSGTSYSSADMAHVEQLTISGDNPSWRPINAYTDGKKTYIQFPKDMQFGDSPSLLGVNSDGGMFSSPTERRVIYRWMSDRLIADTVMDRLKLVLGVGSSQQAVLLTRKGR